MEIFGICPKELAARWICIYLEYIYSDQLLHTAQYIGILIKKIISIPYIASMWKAASITYSNQRVINKYFRLYFGWNFCANEKDIKILALTVLSPFIDYTTIIDKNEEKKD